MGVKDTIESHPLIWLGGLLVTAVGGTWIAATEVLVKPRDFQIEVLRAQVDKLQQQEVIRPADVAFVHAVEPPAKSDSPQIVDRPSASGNATQLNITGTQNQVTIGQDQPDLSADLDKLKKETSVEPRKELLNLGVAWSTGSFVESLIAGDLRSIKLFLEAGMKATTLHKGSSALLYGMQPDLENHPRAILALFIEHGFDLNENLKDRRILNNWSSSSIGPPMLPAPFETPLAPEGYTGGYAGGKFVGPLLLWLVSLGTYRGFPENHIDLIHYAIKHGAEVEIILSYLEYNKSSLADTGPYKLILPQIEKYSSGG